MSDKLHDVRDQLEGSISTAVAAVPPLSGSPVVLESDKRAAVLAASLVVQILGPVVLELLDHAISRSDSPGVHRSEP